MATWKFPLLLLGLSFLAVSVTVTARPCKTLFFFTSTSYYPIPTVQSSNPNPNFSLQYPSLSPRFLTFFFTTAPLSGDDTEFRYSNPSITLSRNAIFFRQEDQLEDEEDVSKRLSSIESYSSIKSSIRDRTKDIMGVMGSMLFGVGCGALTAAMMYLIWSLFWPTTFDFEDSDDDDDASPKKIGYVVLPTKVVDDDDDLKKPAKEVV